jgi:hypothetical protein
MPADTAANRTRPPPQPGIDHQTVYVGPEDTFRVNGQVDHMSKEEWERVLDHQRKTFGLYQPDRPGQDTVTGQSQPPSINHDPPQPGLGIQHHSGYHQSSGTAPEHSRWGL